MLLWGQQGVVGMWAGGPTSEGSTADLDVLGKRLYVFRQVVVLLHLLLRGGMGAVGPGPRPEGLQACLAFCQLLQGFRMAALCMKLGKAALQHVLNLCAQSAFIYTPGLSLGPLHG